MSTTRRVAFDRRAGCVRQKWRLIMMKRMIFVSCIGIALCAASAQTPKAPKAAAKDNNSSLPAQLSGKDPAQQKEALAKVRELMETDRAKTVASLRSGWLKAMIAGGLHDEAAELALAGLLAVPHNTGAACAFQDLRTRALLAGGKNQEALANAKSLFNVATMDKTGEAVQLLCQCLLAAHPQDPGLVNRFRLEQLAGATTQPATRPREAGQGDTSVVPTVLASIQVDPTPYRQAIVSADRPDYNALLGQGNLYLLADQPKEAMTAFQRAYGMVRRDAELPTATESLARAMKAEDGSIGRANSWVLSIRPRAE